MSNLVKCINAAGELRMLAPAIANNPIRMKQIGCTLFPEVKAPETSPLNDSHNEELLAETIVDELLEKIDNDEIVLTPVIEASQEINEPIEPESKEDKPKRKYNKK